MSQNGGAVKRVQKLRVGALISGGGTNLQAIIDACASGAIDAKIVWVGTDTPDAKGLDRAGAHRIATFCVDYASILRSARQDPGNLHPPADFDLTGTLQKQRLFSKTADPQQVELFFISRAIAESKLLEQMAAGPFDLLVLAGFMRNLTPYFIDRVNTDPGMPRIMNIHPALLPAFPGTDGYGDTFRYGCKVGGCTVHFIDYGEDSGPIIGQKAFPIEPGDTLDRIRQKGLRLEWQLYPECIQLYAQRRLKLVQHSYPTSDRTVITRTVVEILPAGHSRRTFRDG